MCSAYSQVQVIQIWIILVLDIVNTHILLAEQNTIETKEGIPHNYNTH